MLWALWGVVVAAVLAVLVLDLSLMHRRPHVPSLGEALAWTLFWIVLALAFNVGVYHAYEQGWIGSGGNGGEAATRFLVGYLAEKSLSLYNTAVIALIVAGCRVPLHLQHYVVFIGLVGAVVARVVLIGLGGWLLARHGWMVYVLGGLLALTTVRFASGAYDRIEPERSRALDFLHRRLPLSTHHDGARLWVREHGRRRLSPLAPAVIAVLAMDVVFAVDAVPAIFAVTWDPFLVLTSNLFALMGMRSLYFVLAGTLSQLKPLRFGLAAVLAFVAFKMLASRQLEIPPGWTLTLVLVALAAGIVAGWLLRRYRPDFANIPVLGELVQLTAMSWAGLRRVVILVFGSSVLLVGVAMLLLPGPAFIVIPTGLAILATEFTWAARVLRRAREAIEGGDGEGPGWLARWRRNRD